jgi:hypothetical protein
MGQKTNPNILRLGITKNWKTEFFEKKKKELPLYVFKDLEIQSYIERFLESRMIVFKTFSGLKTKSSIPMGIFVHDYYQHYSNNSLNLYISYFVSSRSNFHVFGKKKPFLLVNSKGNKKVISHSKKNLISNINFPKDLHNNKKSLNLSKIDNFSNNMYGIRKYLNSNKFNSNISNFTSNPFNNSLENMLKVISNFTSNKFNVIVNFSCINKDFNHLSFLKTKKVKMLQKFKSTPFFKDGLELLFHVAFNKNSARLLAKFISFQLKVIKRPNFFLAFIKQTLTILISSKLSTLKGVKIILKGRLSKGPRAKHRILSIGDVAVQSLNCNMDYFQTTTHNANGSYGIKVWVVGK